MRALQSQGIGLELKREEKISKWRCGNAALYLRDDYNNEYAHVEFSVKGQSPLTNPLLVDVCDASDIGCGANAESGSSIGPTDRQKPGWRLLARGGLTSESKVGAEIKEQLWEEGLPISGPNTIKEFLTLIPDLLDLSECLQRLTDAGFTEWEDIVSTPYEQLIGEDVKLQPKQATAIRQYLTNIDVPAIRQILCNRET